jgi:hypothetical protein
VLSPEAVAEIMNDVGVGWAVAGGWAIDLWLGEQTREHHDIEVMVARRDQHKVHLALSERWGLYCLDPPGSGWKVWNGQRYTSCSPRNPVVVHGEINGGEERARLHSHETNVGRCSRRVACRCSHDHSSRPPMDSRTRRLPFAAVVSSGDGSSCCDR